MQHMALPKLPRGCLRACSQSQEERPKILSPEKSPLPPSLHQTIAKSSAIRFRSIAFQQTPPIGFSGASCGAFSGIFYITLMLSHLLLLVVLLVPLYSCSRRNLPVLPPHAVRQGSNFSAFAAEGQYYQTPYFLLGLDISFGTDYAVLNSDTLETEFEFHLNGTDVWSPASYFSSTEFFQLQPYKLDIPFPQFPWGTEVRRYKLGKPFELLSVDRFPEIKYLNGRYFAYPSKGQGNRFVVFVRQQGANSYMVSFVSPGVDQKGVGVKMFEYVFNPDVYDVPSSYAFGQKEKKKPYQFAGIGDNLDKGTNIFGYDLRQNGSYVSWSVLALGAYDSDVLFSGDSLVLYPEHGKIKAINWNTGKRVYETQEIVPYYDGFDIRITEDGSTLFIFQERRMSLQVLDATSGKTIDTIDLSPFLKGVNLTYHSVDIVQVGGKRFVVLQAYLFKAPFLIYNYDDKWGRMGTLLEYPLANKKKDEPIGYGSSGSMVYFDGSDCYLYLLFGDSLMKSWKYPLVPPEEVTFES